MTTEGGGGSAPWWMGPALVVGFLIALAGPSWLLWRAIQPELGDANSLQAHFETVSVERGAVVFTYALKNRTRRQARLLPGDTVVNVLQSSDDEPIGYASVELPLELAPQTTRHVDVRLDVPDTFWAALRDKPMLGGNTLTQYLRDALKSFDGFELVNEAEGVRIRFPRGW
jgi:hypothetical protein